MNLFLSALIIFSTSFSMRTPKVGDDVDWQFLFSAERPKVFYLSLEEEQDSGIRYTNQEYWVRKDFKNYFTRDRLVSRDDRAIYYNQAELNYKLKNWYAGYALRHVDKVPSHRIVAGYELEKSITLLSRLELRFGINSNFDQVDYNLHARYSLQLLKLFEVFALTVFEDANSEKYRQFKIGISMEIPGKRS